MILDSEELAELQSDILEVWSETAPDKCDVLRGSTLARNPDSPDETSETANAVFEDVPCKYKTASGRERFLADKPDALELIAVQMPACFRVESSDRVRIHAKGDDTEMLLEVIVVLRQSNALTIKAMCSK